MIPTTPPARPRPLAPEVPLFLQKAYHLIDTCDAAIGGWSDDGLTFVVRDTRLFETEVIPQFFKHNKFSSFVRQLNFYGFRKIKFSDSLRIDREAATARFWRFRHDSFRRGRQDLLPDIKRTPSSSASGPAARAASRPAARPVPAAGAAAGEVAGLRTEVHELRMQMASMTANMDALTDMVKKVAVTDDAGDPEGGGVSPVVSSGDLVALTGPAGPAAGRPGHKRKKMDDRAPMEREEAEAFPVVSHWPSSSVDAAALPDWQLSSGELAGVTSPALGDAPCLPEPALSAPLPPISSSPPPSDDEFVDDLFRAFAEDNALFPGLEGDPGSGHDGPAPGAAAARAEYGTTAGNAPCPRLMRRIEDSLATLPRDLHEMVAGRLIDAIAETRPVAAAAGALLPAAPTASPAAPVDAEVGARVDAEVDAEVEAEVGTEVGVVTPEGDARDGGGPAAPALPLPVAVAALRTILAEYGVQVECKGVARARKGFAKSLPVVPVHA